MEFCMCHSFYQGQKQHSLEKQWLSLGLLSFPHPRGSDSPEKSRISLPLWVSHELLDIA